MNRVSLHKARPALEQAEGAESRSRLDIQPKDSGTIAAHVREVLKALGEDPDRQGLSRTPERTEKALRYLTSGYSADVQQVVGNALFDVKYDEVVIVRDIEFFSLCEHHILPFFGRVHVAYLPDRKVIGLSKIPRIVDIFARRLQIQERMTQQIAETIHDLVQPKGVGVMCEAQHFCMMMRGVEKQHSGAITSAMLGAFREDQSTRNELLSLIGQRAKML